MWMDWTEINKTNIYDILARPFKVNALFLVNPCNVAYLPVKNYLSPVLFTSLVNFYFESISKIYEKTNKLGV